MVIQVRRIAVLLFLLTTSTSAQTPERLQSKIEPTRQLKLRAAFTSPKAKEAQSLMKSSIARGMTPLEAVKKLKLQKVALPDIFSAITVNSTTTSSTSLPQIADDLQLMLKAINTLTAEEALATAREVYPVTTTDLFEIARLASNDERVTVQESKTFTYYCDCTLRTDVSPASTSGQPLHAFKTETATKRPYTKNKYPWQCFNFWNEGLRALLLADTGVTGASQSALTIDQYLSAMKASTYPLHYGFLREDISNPNLDIRVVFGAHADSLARFLRLTTTYMGLISTPCFMERPTETNHFIIAGAHRGNGHHMSSLTYVWRLKDVLPVLKRNGYSIATIGEAIKKAYTLSDDELKRNVLQSFEAPHFSNAEILEITRIINS